MTSYALQCLLPVCNRTTRVSDYQTLILKFISVYVLPYHHYCSCHSFVRHNSDTTFDPMKQQPCQWPSLLLNSESGVVIHPVININIQTDAGERFRQRVAFLSYCVILNEFFCWHFFRNTVKCRLAFTQISRTVRVLSFLKYLVRQWKVRACVQNINIMWNVSLNN